MARTITARHTQRNPVQPAEIEHEPSYPRSRTHKFMVPEIIFGVGSLAELGNVLQRIGVARPLLVTDPGVRAAGWVGRAMSYLDKCNLDVAVWDGVTSNPKDFEIVCGLERFREWDGDALVSIGGGSCIDAAKAIAILSTNGGTIFDYEGVDRVSLPIPPMVMVPSTGGTGADVSQFCIITDTTRRLKATIGGRALVPDVSITDPYLLTTMPQEISAYTALDALAHAIEAYVSKGADFLTDVHAISAMRGISSHLLASLEDPRDLAAREGIARASLQAGLAFSNALLGATHAISHQIGGLLDLHHGLLNAILLPHVIRFNGATHPFRYLDVAEAIGIVVDPSNPRSTVDLLAERIQLMATGVGVPSSLSAVGVKVEHIACVAENALRDAYITTNPRPLTAIDVRDICLAAL